jgi:methyl-accepting chemotaxis protein
VDTKGKMLNHPDKKLIGKDFSKEKFMQNILSKKTGAERYIWNGKKKLVGFAYLDSVGAILVGGANMGELVGSIKRDIITKTMIVGLIVIAVATVLINMLINRTIVMPIIKLGDFIEKVSEGDLTAEVKLMHKDEVGSIGDDMNCMTANINNTLSQVKTAANDVNVNSESLSESGNTLSEAIRAQSERTANVERSIQEILTSFDEVSENIIEISSEITIIRSSAQEGQVVLDDTVKGIGNLSETVLNTSDTIDNLGESSKQIIEIVSVISDIADQTNLLALNAAIEAARAGEHGRGFAVVADEVRKLAERTVTATTEITNMTNGINMDVAKSVDDMKKGAALAKEGVELAANLQESLELIIRGVVETAGKIEAISVAIEQQNRSSKKISEDSSEIARFSKKNAEIAASNRQQAEMLNDLAHKLLGTVEEFRLKS